MNLNYTQEAIADLILQAPTVTHSELATLFECSEGRIKALVASPKFKTHLAERKSKLIDPSISRSLNDRIRGVTLQAMNIISKKLDDNPDPDYALQVLQMVNGEARASAKAKK